VKGGYWFIILSNIQREAKTKVVGGVGVKKKRQRNQNNHTKKKKNKIRGGGERNHFAESVKKIWLQREEFPPGAGLRKGDPKKGYTKEGVQELDAGKLSRETG